MRGASTASTQRGANRPRIGRLRLYEKKYTTVTIQSTSYVRPRPAQPPYPSLRAQAARTTARLQEQGAQGFGVLSVTLVLDCSASPMRAICRPGPGPLVCPSAGAAKGLWTYCLAQVGAVACTLTVYFGHLVEGLTTHLPLGGVRTSLLPKLKIQTL